MTTDEERKRDFLARIKSESRSSPHGRQWNEFYLILKQQCRDGAGTHPPVPLILAASGESDSSKHRRLSDQLDWAIANGCFGVALAFLENLAEDEWNFSPVELWHIESYP